MYSLITESKDTIVVKGLDSDLIINHGGENFKVFINKGKSVTTTSWKMVGEQVKTNISSGDLKGIEINPDSSVKLVSGLDYKIDPNYKVLVLSTSCRQITFLKCDNIIRVEIIDRISEQKLFEKTIENFD